MGKGSRNKKRNRSSQDLSQDHNITTGNQAKKIKTSQSAPSSIQKPTRLSPSFSGKKTGVTGSASASKPSGTPTIIGEPKDVNAERRQEVFSRQKEDAKRSQTFNSGPIKLGDGAPAGTPTPGKKDVKVESSKKKLKKAKQDKENGNQDEKVVKKEKGAKEEKPKTTPKVVDKVAEAARLKLKEQGKQEWQKASTAGIAAFNALSKSSNGKPADIKQWERVQYELCATKSLREALPADRLARTTRNLKKTYAFEPSEMSVLLTVAREVMIDMSRQTVEQTKQVGKSVQAELVRMLDQQRENLAKLEGKSDTVAEFAEPVSAKRAPKLEQEKVVTKVPADTFMADAPSPESTKPASEEDESESDKEDSDEDKENKSVKAEETSSEGEDGDMDDDNKSDSTEVESEVEVPSIEVKAEESDTEESSADENDEKPAQTLLLEAGANRQTHDSSDEEDTSDEDAEATLKKLKHRNPMSAKKVLF